MSRCLVFLLTLSLCSALPNSLYGTLTAPDELAVSNSVTNINEFADFTIRFIPTTLIPASGLLDVVFPSQFPLGLGGTAACSDPCTVLNRTVTVQFSASVSAGIERKVLIYSVLNPPSAGGTAYFQLKTWNGNNLLDANLAFCNIGVENAVTAMTTGSVQIAATSSSKAGELGSYRFSFKPNRFLPAFSWLRFTFPANGFGLSQYPSCQSFAVNGKTVKGTLACATTQRQVQLTGISEDIQAGTEIGIAVAATNPPQSGVTQFFWIETGRNRTNTVYERMTAVQGVTITPGRINAKYFSQTDGNVMLTKGNVVLFTMRFTPTNPIEAGGSILVQFNNNFNMGVPGGAHYWVNYGLDDFSASQTVAINYATSTQLLTISSFAAFSPKEISLQLELVCSILSGSTPTLVVQTVKSDGETIIDQDSTISAEILDVPRPAITATLGGNAATDYYATGKTPIVALNFQIVPNLEIPALGYIRIYFPKGFSVNSAYPTCQTQPKNMPLAAATSCSFIDGILTVQLYAWSGVATNTGNFRAELDSSITVAEGERPAEEGYYVFNVLTYDQQSRVLESGTCSVTMTPNILTTHTFSSAHDQISKPTIIAISFLTINAVPVGTPPASITDQQGFISVEFPTQDALGNLLFDTSLGFTVSAANPSPRTQGSTIPCTAVSGITAASGYDLKCVLDTVPTTAGSNVVVVVSNFAVINSGVTVILHFPGVKYVQTAFSPTLTVTTYYKQNRRITRLNTATEPSASFLTPNSLAVASSVATAFTSTVLTVATSTTISGSVNFATALNGATNTFIVYFDTTHDNGYCGATASLTCTVNAITYNFPNCVCEPIADMVLVNVGGTTLSGATTVSLNNIINPGSVPPSADTFRVFTMKDGAMQQIIQFTAPLSPQVTGTPVVASVSPSSTALSDVNVKFTVNAQATHAVRAGGAVTIGFPSGFSLHTSSPSVTCAISSLVSLTAAGVKCVVFAATAAITNFQTIPALGLIQMEIRGVKNPSSGTSSGYFSLTTYSSDGYKIDETLTIQGFSYSAAIGIGGITVSSLLTLPTNARTMSEMAFSFQASRPLAKGGLIIIAFPAAQYPQLPSSLSLKLAGGLISFQSATISGSQLRVVTDTDSSGDVVTAYIQGLTNSDEGTTESFAITTQYDGAVMCQTGSQVLATYPRAAPTLTIENWDFYPRNEGERATYSFTLVPRTNIELQQNILVIFPPSFDRRLGGNLRCDSDYLLGVLNCSVGHANVMIVSGHEGFLWCDTCRFTLNLYGIRNPAAGLQGYIAIGPIFSNLTYSEYNFKVGPITTVPSPTYNNLWQVAPDNLSARSANQFVFNMTTSQSIPQSSYGGAVWLVFPADYDLGGAETSCTSSKYWANGVPDCAVYYDRVQVTGQELDYIGTVLITVDGVPNPLYDVVSGSVLAKVYDETNKRVIDSSYANTNPNQFTYVYPGPLILINNDQQVEGYRGTKTQDIPVTLSYPCALNITLIPTLGDFCLLPYHVALYIGQTTSSFRISTPLYLASGTYYIKWTLSGEVYPPFYTSVATTRFIVRSTTNIPVTVDAIGAVPQHGTSLPIKVWVPYAPDLNITVTISLPENYFGLHLNATVLEFSRGVVANYFLLTADNNTKLDTAELTLALSGPSSSIYYLSKEKLEFSVTTQSGALPRLSAVTSQTISRAAAKFRFSVSRPAMVFYESALRGTSQPSFSRVRRGGPALYESTKSQFGSLAVTTAGTFVVNNLMAGTKYTLFLCAEDLEYNQSPTIIAHDYETSPTYRSAESSMSFLQTFMIQDDIDKALNAVKLLLSLDQSRVVFKSVTPSSSAGRRLAVASSVLAFYILDDPSSDVYPTPKMLGDLLATKKQQLATMLDNFDSSWVIAGNEVVIGQCRFQQTPSIVASHATINVTAELADEGYVYGVCVDATTGYPSSGQIAKGVNAGNAPTASFQAHVPGKVQTSYTFTGLNSATVYKVFVTCGNINPGGSELLPDAKVVGSSLKTKDPADPVPIVLKFSSYLYVPLLLALE